VATGHVRKWNNRSCDCKKRIRVHGLLKKVMGCVTLEEAGHVTGDIIVC